MTVSTEINTSGPYQGDGSTKQFGIGFSFLDESHLKVIQTCDQGETELALQQDYQVTHNKDNKGFISLAHALPFGSKLTITRNVPFTQNAQYAQGDAFPATSHEQALDKLTMLAQQLKANAGRTIKAPHGETIDLQLPSFANRSNKLLGFDEESVPQAISIGNGLNLAHDFLTIKDGIGILSNEEGIHILYGQGLGIYDGAITVKAGNGLIFDEQARLEIEKEITQIIQNTKNGLIDLEGLVNYLAKRVTRLEISSGGEEVAIHIGNGLQFDQQGNLTIKPHTGISVTSSGISIRIGDGLEVDASGNIKIRDDIYNGTLKSFNFTEVPTTKINNFIYVIDREEIYSWVDTLFYKGYRSPKIGSIEDEGVNALRPWQVDATGLIFKKNNPEMARLWSWAKECGIVIPEKEWSPKIFMFADVDDEHFRVPDLRDLFKRYTGKNADDGLERKAGTYQADQLREHNHDSIEPADGKFSGNTYIGKIRAVSSKTGITGGSETRPVNISVNPRIHM